MEKDSNISIVIKSAICGNNNLNSRSGAERSFTGVIRVHALWKLAIGVVKDIDFVSQFKITGVLQTIYKSGTNTSRSNPFVD